MQDEAEVLREARRRAQHADRVMLEMLSMQSHEQLLSEPYLLIGRAMEIYKRVELSPEERVERAIAVSERSGR